MQKGLVGKGEEGRSDGVAHLSGNKNGNVSCLSNNIVQIESLHATLVSGTEQDCT